MSIVRLAIPTEAAYRSIYEARYHPEVLRWADDHPIVPTLTEFLARRRNRMADPACLERIILYHGRAVGTVSAFGINTCTQDCELGIVLVDRTCWGRGIGPRAMRAFFDLLRAHGLNRIYLETFADNTRAQAAFRKVGFVHRQTFWDPESQREVIVMTHELTNPDEAQ